MDHMESEGKACPGCVRGRSFNGALRMRCEGRNFRIGTEQKTIKVQEEWSERGNFKKL
jgi:hypothetical protein